ncbi:hypothetical protein ACPUEK_02465 [Marinomonas gallaica]|uniref:hypothetical protein n=1 Tax=Marinomonas gallaica TaxID=1806667 RepID=UPI003CE44997
MRLIIGLLVYSLIISGCSEDSNKQANEEHNHRNPTATQLIGQIKPETLEQDPLAVAFIAAEQSSIEDVYLAYLYAQLGEAYLEGGDEHKAKVISHHLLQRIQENNHKQFNAYLSDEVLSLLAKTLDPSALRNALDENLAMHQGERGPFEGSAIVQAYARLGNIEKAFDVASSELFGEFKYMALTNIARDFFKQSNWPQAERILNRINLPKDDASVFFLMDNLWMSGYRDASRLVRIHYSNTPMNPLHAIELKILQDESVSEQDYQALDSYLQEFSQSSADTLDREVTFNFAALALARLGQVKRTHAVLERIRGLADDRSNFGKLTLLYKEFQIHKILQESEQQQLTKTRIVELTHKLEETSKHTFALISVYQGHQEFCEPFEDVLSASGGYKIEFYSPTHALTAAQCGYLAAFIENIDTTDLDESGKLDAYLESLLAIYKHYDNSERSALTKRVMTILQERGDLTI